MPRGAVTLNFVDYTARRVATNSEYLSLLPPESGPRELIMTLADDNVGVLSQSTTRRLETLMKKLRKQSWDSFTTRYWMLAVRDAAIARQAGDLEAAVEHLETAVDQLDNAIDTLSDVVRDQSDRGLIAVLNAYAYRPLVVEYETQLSEE